MEHFDRAHPNQSQIRCYQVEELVLSLDSLLQKFENQLKSMLNIPVLIESA